MDAQGFLSLICIIHCAIMRSIFPSNNKKLCITQIYTTKKQCGHVDRDFDSLAQFRSTCAYCVGKHMDVQETKA